jgi:hypothetical protein
MWQQNGQKKPLETFIPSSSLRALFTKKNAITSKAVGGNCGQCGGGVVKKLSTPLEIVSDTGMTSSKGKGTE